MWRCLRTRPCVRSPGAPSSSSAWLGMRVFWLKGWALGFAPRFVPPPAAMEFRPPLPFVQRNMSLDSVVPFGVQTSSGDIWTPLEDRVFRSRSCGPAIPHQRPAFPFKIPHDPRVDFGIPVAPAEPVAAGSRRSEAASSEDKILEQLRAELERGLVGVASEPSCKGLFPQEVCGACGVALDARADARTMALALDCVGDVRIVERDLQACTMVCSLGRGRGRERSVLCEFNAAWSRRPWPLGAFVPLSTCLGLGPRGDLPQGGFLFAGASSCGSSVALSGVAAPRLLRSVQMARPCDRQRTQVREHLLFCICFWFFGEVQSSSWPCFSRSQVLAGPPWRAIVVSACNSTLLRASACAFACVLLRFSTCVRTHPICM